MSKIVAMQIKNFRKFEHFNAVFGNRNVICLIGRGDSGKSSVLDALSYCLSSSWIIPVSDYDFHNCDISHPIEISVVITDPPEDFSLMNKYAMYYSGWNEEKRQIGDVTDNGCVPALLIVLTVDSTLEPKWEIINHTSKERISISAKDRARLNVYMVADYVNSHFAWASGSPLNTLSRSAGESIDSESLLTVMRNVREASKNLNFGNFSELLCSVEQQAEGLGLKVEKLSPAFDMKKLAVKEGTVCLHDDNGLPLRLMGKGSRRLMSIAIQSAVSNGGGITLIDEIEQGLEPDRVNNLVHSLKQNTIGQFIFTTHANEALVEMDAEDVFWLRDGGTPVVFTKDMQGLLRKNPSAFFGRKVLLCEGQTECGFCRALNDFFVKDGARPCASVGVTIVNGGGNEFLHYAELFAALNVPCLLFCDSDEDNANQQKSILKDHGIHIVDWDAGDSLEEGVYKDVPDCGVIELNKLALRIKSNDNDADLVAAKESITTLVKNKMNEVTESMLFGEQAMFSIDLRKAIGAAAKGKKGTWFKSIRGGFCVGNIVCGLYDQLPLKGRVRTNIEMIRKWIYDV